MSHAITSLPLPQVAMSLPSHVLHKSLDAAPALPPKQALACVQRAGSRSLACCLRHRLALSIFERTLGRESAQKLGISARFPVEPVIVNLSSVTDGFPAEAFDTHFSGSQEVVNTVVSMAPVMKRGYGAFGGATLEKAKLDLSQSTVKIAPQTADGGGGGDIGKRNSHGGGDGGDDGGDDDDYFGDFDEGDEGDEGGFFRRRIVLQEIFDRKIVEAVLQEWYRTMSDLPAGLLQAFEMGLISSAQMVRYLSINARPTVARLISRALPPAMSRAFIGRMIADPSFLYKMFLEQATTICCSVLWELRHRKERIKQEWHLALINVLTVSVCNAAIVWSLAPCRSYGNTFQFNLQNTLQKLPNNVFERSYLLREFDMQKRVHCFFYKAAELCMVGMAAGTVNGFLSKLAAKQKEERTSVVIPSVSTSALSYGAFLGLSGNFRYQLLYGIERVMQDHFDVLGVVIFFSSALRLLNIQIGDMTRLAWLGLDVDPMFQSGSMLKGYNRPSQVSEKSTSNWLIAKKAIISGLFGSKQDSKENIGEGSIPSKAPRRRVVKRKVTASS